MTESPKTSENPEGIRRIINKRRIEEVVHFTTNRGVLGVLVTRKLKSRALLDKEQYLEYLYTPNAIYRDRDAAWLPYVNLSVSRINSIFFRISSGKWHVNEPMWWCVLSLDPEILTHEGVYFVTTNNAYACAIRGRGPSGMNAMFADEVQEFDSGTMAIRRANTPARFTTSVQAEVLYPGEVDTSYLRTIYVTRPEDKAVVQSWCDMWEYEDVDVLLRSDLRTVMEANGEESP